MQVFCGVLSQQSKHEAISVTIYEVKRGQAGPVADGFQTWKCISYDDVTLLVLTNRNAHVQYKDEELQIQPTGNEELVLASDTPSWRAKASLVQVISEDFCFNFTNQPMHLAILENLL
jgi:hypothetical protein